MAEDTGATPPWKTTVIVSTALQNHEINSLLSAQEHRIRFSDSVEPGVFIFPLSGEPLLAREHIMLTQVEQEHIGGESIIWEDLLTCGLCNRDVKTCFTLKYTCLKFSVLLMTGTAFLLVNPQDVFGTAEETGLIIRIKMFMQVHRNSFLLLYAPFNGEKELEILKEIQKRFFGSNLRILPVRNNAEIVKGMLNIAKVTSKPHADSVRRRMSVARAHIIGNSPVRGMFRDML